MRGTSAPLVASAAAYGTGLEQIAGDRIMNWNKLVRWSFVGAASCAVLFGAFGGCVGFTRPKDEESVGARLQNKQRSEVEAGAVIPATPEHVSSQPVLPSSTRFYGGGAAGQSSPPPPVAGRCGSVVGGELTVEDINKFAETALNALQCPRLTGWFSETPEVRRPI